MLLGYKARHTTGRDLHIPPRLTMRIEIAIDDVSGKGIYIARPRLRLAGVLIAF